MTNDTRNMKNRTNTPYIAEESGTSVSAHLCSVEKVWRVHVDERYAIRQDSGLPAYGLFLTWFGGGDLLIHSSGHHFELAPGVAIVLSPGEPCSYAAKAVSGWGFHCIEFGANRETLDEIGIPLDRALASPWGESSHHHCERMISEITERSHAFHASLAADLTHMLVGLARANLADRIDDSQLVLEACRLIRDNAPRIKHLDDVIDRIPVGRGRFFRDFRRVTGVTPHQYLNAVKLESAAFMLRSTSRTLSEIADMVGYSDAFHLSRSFKRCYGVAPRTYRNS
jgi:AraC-like DNA-binding protein